MRAGLVLVSRTEPESPAHDEPAVRSRPDFESRYGVGMRRRGKKKTASKPARRKRKKAKLQRPRRRHEAQQPFGQVERRATRGEARPTLSQEAELAILRWMFDDALTPRAPEHLH